MATTTDLPPVARHREAIYRHVLGIVHDPTEAEDLTQEALLRAHQKMATLHDPDSLVPWLYRIATNVAYDRFREASYRHRPRHLVEDRGGPGDSGSGAAVDAGPRLDKVMEQKEMSACVQEYLAALPVPSRTVILLHDVQGLTNPEIAVTLQLPVATVKMRLHRARKKLRAALAEGCSFSSDERGVEICEPKSSPG